MPHDEISHSKSGKRSIWYNADMSTDDCEFCNQDTNFTKTVIKNYKYWRIELHANQNYLGRSAVILNRHLEDIFDISIEEREELFQITKKLRDSLIKVFGADMLNYTSLGNIVQHVHLHVIPRYENPAMFADITFNDERWGQNYAPYNREFRIPEGLYMKIKEEILTYLEG